MQHKIYLNHKEKKMAKTYYPKSVDTYKNDPEFYEELTVLKAQEAIAELMQNSNTSKTGLAKLLNQSKSHITDLLSEGRNLTLKTLARICFYMKAEVNFSTSPIGKKFIKKRYKRK